MMERFEKTILIACPVFDRAWILPHWLKAIEKQDFPLENLGFLFELGPDDDETHDILWDWQSKHPEVIVFDAQIYMGQKHESHPGNEGQRIWGPTKYENMVVLRNNLLERATGLSEKFDYYFSLDSDILLFNPQTLNHLIKHSQGRDVISPLTFMTQYDCSFPSAMTWRERPGGLAKRDLDLYHRGKIFEADIVMAAVFMQKYVYTKVRYRWHRQGEDLGFAAELHHHNFKSYGVWDIYCPHIMGRTLLNDYIKTGIDGRNPSYFI